jgi:DNA-directed RNA polymerase sigma subunit (sigma70/sigma32)
MLLPTVNDFDDSIIDDYDICDKYNQEELLVCVGQNNESSNGDLTSDPVQFIKKIVSNPNNKIASQEQQAQWCEIKDECDRKLAFSLLYFDQSIDFIENSIENHRASKKKIFKKLKQKDNCESGVVDWYYSDKIIKEGLSLVRYLSTLKGDSKTPVIQDLVGNYNISHAYFTLPFLSKITKEYKKALSNNSISDFLNKSGLSKEEIDALMSNIKALKCKSETLKKRLILTNLRMVFKSSAHYYYKRGGINCTNFGDLFNEGFIGLNRAADLYAYGAGAVFTSYASYWIDQLISRYIKNNSMVRKPIYLTEIENEVVGYINENYDRESPNFSVNDKIKKDIEEALRKKISDSVWGNIVVRINGGNTYLPIDSCEQFVDDDADDLFDCENHKKDVQKILSLVKEKIVDDGKVVHGKTLSNMDYLFFIDYFLNDMDYSSIAQKHNVPFSKVNKGVKGALLVARRVSTQQP